MNAGDLAGCGRSYAYFSFLRSRLFYRQRLSLLLLTVNRNGRSYLLCINSVISFIEGVRCIHTIYTHTHIYLCVYAHRKIEIEDKLIVTVPARVEQQRGEEKNFIEKKKKPPEPTESVWGTRTYTPTYVRTYTYVCACVLLTTLPSDTVVLERGGDSFSSLNYYLHTIRAKNTPVKLPWIRLYWSNSLGRRQLNFNYRR